jgi:purine nucleoside phosphorylase
MEPQQATVLIVQGTGLVEQMRAVETRYREATPFQCEKEPLRVTALDGLTRLTSALQ